MTIIQLSRTWSATTRSPNEDLAPSTQKGRCSLRKRENLCHMESKFTQKKEGPVEVAVRARIHRALQQARLSSQKEVDG